MDIIEILKNPKKRAIIQLVLYGIFFTIVLIMINTKSNDASSYNEYKEKNIEQNEIINTDTEINEYEYEFIIDNIEIDGNIVDGENTFVIDNITYVKSNDITYNMSTNEQVNDFNIDKYLYNNIEQLIEKSEFIEKTTFKDNSEKTTYLLNDENYCNECNMIVEKSDYINKVTIGENIELKYTIYN